MPRNNQHCSQKRNIKRNEIHRHERRSCVSKRKTVGDCRLCQKDHPLRYCQIFRKMSIAQRYETVRKHRYCENCFALSHGLINCRSTKRCNQCQQRHHSMLHEFAESREVTPPTIEISTTSALQRVITLLPTAVVKIKTTDEYFNVRVLINPCEPTSSIAPWLVKRYRLKVDQIGTQRICSLQMQSHTQPGSTFKVKAMLSPHLPRLVPQDDIDPTVVSNFKNLILADPIFYKKANINMILGAEIYQKILQTGLIPSNIGTPAAQNTLLGWILVGSFSE